MFEGQVVGEYFADLVVQNMVLIEVKSVQVVTPVMQAQVVNYLKISGLRLGFLVNFQGVRAEWSRFVNSPP
jgi:GxxExxY protein